MSDSGVVASNRPIQSADEWVEEAVKVTITRSEEITGATKVTDAVADNEQVQKLESD